LPLETIQLAVSSFMETIQVMGVIMAMVAGISRNKSQVGHSKVSLREPIMCLKF